MINEVLLNGRLSSILYFENEGKSSFEKGDMYKPSVSSLIYFKNLQL